MLLKNGKMKNAANTAAAGRIKAEYAAFCLSFTLCILCSFKDRA